MLLLEEGCGTVDCGRTLNDCTFAGWLSYVEVDGPVALLELYEPFFRLAVGVDQLLELGAAVFVYDDDMLCVTGFARDEEPGACDRELYVS